MADVLKDSRLRPCPFCGGEARMVVTSYGDPDWDGCCDDDFDDEDIEAIDSKDDQYKAECWNCGATFSEGYTFYTKEQAIKAWNRRV